MTNGHLLGQAERFAAIEDFRQWAELSANPSQFARNAGGARKTDSEDGPKHAIRLGARDHLHEGGRRSLGDHVGMGEGR